MREFVGRYCRLVAGLTEAPDEFNFALAYHVLGAALIRETCLVRNGARIGPGLWTMLVAPAGMFRRSTALSVAAKTIASADPSRAPLNGAATPQAILSKARGEPALCLSAGDVGAAYPFEDRRGPSRAMLVELSRIFDSGAPLSIMAAAQEETLMRRPWSAEALGFLSRFLLVPAFWTTRALAVPGAGWDERLSSEVLGDIAQMRLAAEPEVRLSPQAASLFDSWAAPLREAGLPEPAEFPPPPRHLAVCALKYSLLNACMRRSATVEREDMREAVLAANWSQGRLAVLARSA